MIAPAFQPIKENALPGLMLLAFSVLIIVLYSMVQPVQNFFHGIADLKLRGGLLFSFTTTAAAGALVPFLVNRWAKKNSDLNRPGTILFLSIFWGYKGIEIDYFYKLQQFLFGATTDWYVIAVKTVFDQMIYAPFWALPLMIVLFSCRNTGFRLNETRVCIERSMARASFIPLLLSNWVVWIPSVVMIYHLPLALQLPIQNLVLSFWSLIVLFHMKPDRMPAG